MNISRINFNSLPQKAHKNIFQHLTQNERQRNRIVCPLWNQLITEHFPVEIEITNDNYEKLFQCVNARRISLTNLTAEFSGKIAFGTSLCNLEVVGKVLTSNLTRILLSCPNLESLAFSSLKQVLSIDNSEFIGLPKLKTLEIKVRPDQETFTTDELIIINTLRNVRFGSLEAINISVGNMMEWDEDDEDDASLISRGFSLDDMEIQINTEEADTASIGANFPVLHPSIESQDNPNVLNLPDSQLMSQEGQPTGAGLRSEIAVIVNIPTTSNISSISERPERPIVTGVSAGMDAMSEDEQSSYSRPGLTENEFAARLFTTRLQMQLTSSDADLDAILSGSFSRSELRPGLHYITNTNQSTLKKTVFFELVRNNSEKLKTFIVKARPDFICFGNIGAFSKELAKVQFEEVEYSFGRSQLCLEFMLLQAQSKLVKIKVHILDDMWKYLMAAVEKSSETLTEIDMKILSLSEDPIDVSAFSKCKILTTMKLFHFYEKSSINILPVSLTKLLINGPLSTEDLNSITNRLVNLVDFTLILNASGGKTDLNLFKKFVSMPKIAKLLFIQSLLDVDDISDYCKSTQGVAANIQGPKELKEPYSFNSSIQYVAVTVDPSFPRVQEIDHKNA